MGSTTDNITQRFVQSPRASKVDMCQNLMLDECRKASQNAITLHGEGAGATNAADGTGTGGSAVGAAADASDATAARGAVSAAAQAAGAEAANKLSTLIFVNTKGTADFVSRRLYQNGNGMFRTDSIHGDRTQQQREAALSSFKSGRVNVLVATDVAARGLDIPGVTHVLNFDM